MNHPDEECPRRSAPRVERVRWCPVGDTLKSRDLPSARSCFIRTCRYRRPRGVSGFHSYSGAMVSTGSFLRSVPGISRASMSTCRPSLLATASAPLDSPAIHQAPSDGGPSRRWMPHRSFDLKVTGRRFMDTGADVWGPVIVQRAMDPRVGTDDRTDHPARGCDSVPRDPVAMLRPVRSSVGLLSASAFTSGGASAAHTEV